MRLSQFLLLVTLAFVTCCITSTGAEDLTQIKSLKTDSNNELVNQNLRTIKEGSVDEERGFKIRKVPKKIVKFIKRMVAKVAKAFKKKWKKRRRRRRRRRRFSGV